MQAPQPMPCHACLLTNVHFVPTQHLFSQLPQLPQGRFHKKINETACCMSSAKRAWPCVVA
jgi:hypothetical protein